MKRIFLGMALAVIALPAQAQQADGTRLRVVPAQPATQATPAPEQQAAGVVLDRFARARENIIALREGRRSVSDLTPLELQDVLDFDRRVRGGYPDPRSPKEQCIDDEVRRAGGEPTRLAWKVIELKCRD